jgi:hypothetical protein
VQQVGLAPPPWRPRWHRDSRHLLGQCAAAARPASFSTPVGEERHQAGDRGAKAGQFCLVEVAGPVRGDDGGDLQVGASVAQHLQVLRQAASRPR